MKFISEISLDRFEAWSGGIDTLNVLVEKGLCDILESMLECELYPDGMTDTELNDLLWFERDAIAEWLGFSNWEDLENDGEEDEEDEEERSIEEAKEFLNECIENGEDFDAFCAGCTCSSCPFDTHCGTVLKCKTAYELMLEGFNFEDAVNRI